MTKPSNYTSRPRILAEKVFNSGRRRGWALVAAIPLFGVAAAFGIAPDTETRPLELRAVIESIQLPTPQAIDDGRYFVREERVVRGDTVSAMLDRLDIREPAAIDFIRNDRAMRPLHQLAPGRAVRARTDAEGDLHWLEYATGQGSYYTPGGLSLRRAFLRSPLEFSRISSGFSNARYHPILQEMRAHRGIDYAAPIGTPIKAVANGTVDFVGRQGGYGNLVILAHANSVTTVYGHLNNFASTMRKGARVNQGDIIGTVGMTGLATGPHLHFEFRIAGVHMDPLKVAMPQALPITNALRPAFEQATAQYSEQLRVLRGSNLARLE